MKSCAMALPISDENEGYDENWAAPEPKVFVLWRLEEENARPKPVLASVGHAEGTGCLTRRTGGRCFHVARSACLAWQFSTEAL